MFRDRAHAGRQLAESLRSLRNTHPIVVGLPRGGAPVAYQIAKVLRAPLEVVIVRKLGAPGQPDLGVGAIGEGGIVVFNRPLMKAVGVTEGQLGPAIERERAEVERLATVYRGDRPMMTVSHRTVILVDDGLATGFTARAASDVLRQLGAAYVALAVPIASAGTLQAERPKFAKLACLAAPHDFVAISDYYRDFAAPEDADIARQLEAARDWVEEPSDVS